MIFESQKIPGVFLVKPNPFEDERGIFRRHFCANEFSEIGIVADVTQANLSENPKAFTLRGFHYQNEPYAEGKTLSCLKGKIYDVIVDLRPSSKTFKTWISFELSDLNRYSIHIPPGCANAFLTLEDNSLIHYYCSAAYNPLAEHGIRFNDPTFNFVWPRSPLHISEKDLNHPDFE